MNQPFNMPDAISVHPPAHPPSSAHFGHCSACREQIMDYVRKFERDAGEKFNEHDLRLKALELLMGSEATKTGLFGAVDRAFAGISDANDKLDVIAKALAARENQAKGATWAFGLLWTVIGAGGTGLIALLYNAIQAASRH